MSEILEVKKVGPVVTLTLNRPGRRNALNADLVRALLETLETAAADASIRVVVLTGTGSVFSAGADLAALQQMQDATAEENLADSELLARLFERIYLHPKSVIARINGHAIAGGCGLAAVCDFSIAAENAKMGFTEVRIGFVPAIVAVFVLRKLGEAAARDLLLRGHLITAEAAAAMGLITRAVPAEQLDETVLALADELASNTSATAVALTKKLLANVPGMGLKEALAYATQLNALARGTEDYRAGLAAFLHKLDSPWKASISGYDKA